MIATRRHRHINPRHAGAALVLDARSISGLSDGSQVTTWADKSGNGYNAAQATSSKKPLYKVNRAGGQPGVLFAAGDDDLTISAGYTNLFKNDNDWSLMVVFNSTNIGTAPVFISSSSALGGFFFELTAGGSYYAGAGGGTFRTYTSPTVSSGESHIFTFQKYTSTTGDLRKNGVLSTSYSGSFSATENVDRDMHIGNYHNAAPALAGDVFLVLAVRASLSASLLKRLEHAAAFSFKIPCS